MLRLKIPPGTGCPSPEGAGGERPTGVVLRSVEGGKLDARTSDLSGFVQLHRPLANSRLVCAWDADGPPCRAWPVWSTSE